MDLVKINEYPQQRLREEGPIERVTAVKAAGWLDAVGLLADSKKRRGRELRRLLRDERIVGGIRDPSAPTRHKWWIRRV